ncbi:hypothetical protein AMECASPLE_033380 [Ameca splendens]|uniref:Uncharacterized protein n=1 Tax=Ameca splendens TaxID=208324 RepID=A0ABV1A2M5_9TELE
MKITKPFTGLESLSYDVIGLYPSYILVCTIFGKWRHTCGCTLRQHLKHTASFCDIMGKSKQNCQYIRKRKVEHHKSDSSLGTISRGLKESRSSVQQLYVSINTTEMSCHHTARHRDRCL